MDRKQKERLRVLLKARKRADKVLAERREVERKKQERNQRLAVNRALMQQYTQELTALAEESGLLALAEQAAQERGGSLDREVSYYVDYGVSGSGFHDAFSIAKQGELRASHLALTITWEAFGALREVEVRIHKHGTVTFHNSVLPVFPILWRWNPRLLQKMLTSALQHPRSPLLPARKKKNFQS